MTRLEGIFIYVALAGYAVSFLLFLTALVFRKENLRGRAFALIVCSVVAHTAAIVARWEATGHIPVMHTYENSLTGSWVVIAIYLILRRMFRQAEALGVIVTPLALLIIGNGIQVGAELQPLEPAFRSNWLYIHVFFAWFTFGSYVSATAAGALHLLKETGLPLRERLPEQKLLNELAFRLILFGVFAQAIMLGSGSIWAYGLWGRYWGWDPVETWSLITWLVYGLNLHLRTTYGWDGRKAAWLTVASFLGVVALFFGFGHGSSIHTEMLSR